MEEMNVTTIPFLYLKQTYTKSKKRICKSLSKGNFNPGMKLERVKQGLVVTGKIVNLCW